jgi:uncharacterized protein involved in exopolysaccharide biosynthesis
MSEGLSHPVWREENPVLLTGSPPPPPPPETTGTPINFYDACYILYRHKWKILACSLAGFFVAGWMYAHRTYIFRSEAKLMVKYVPEVESVVSAEGEGQVRAPVLRGDTVVNSELQLLTRVDLARKVAEKVGPEVILARLGGGSNLNAAARFIYKNTHAFAPEKANVIQVIFEHPDPAVVEPVLRELIKQYLLEHYEVHQGLANLENLQVRKEHAESDLKNSERKLIEAKSRIGVFSVESASKSAAERVELTKTKLFEAQTQLAELQAGLKAVEEQAQVQEQARQEAANAAAEQNTDERERSRTEYRQILDRIAFAKHKQMDSLGFYKPGSAMSSPIENEIQEQERKRKEMLKQDPSLALVTSGSSNGREFDPSVERERILQLQARIATLTNQLHAVQDEEAKVYKFSDEIVPLEREKNLRDQNYRYFAASLERTQFDSELGSSRDSGIAVFQEPSPPVIDPGNLHKSMGVAAAGGIGLGIALAILLELFVDQRIKRPVELERLVPLPLYVSVPKVGHRRQKLISNGAEKRDLAAGNGVAQPALTWNGNGTPPPDDRLQPYFDALRDRILNRFDSLSRKPKLVGVCGCENDRNVTRTSAGLATALSEGGSRKVLLVKTKGDEARVCNVVVNGQKSCSLLEALEADKRQTGLIAPNLYVATAERAGERRVVSSPSGFMGVVPQLTASDFDWIVFDLPPVTQASITPRLAKYMDLTLLVIEAEQAHRKSVKQAGSVLLEFTPNVALVLNNTETKLPQWLQQAV